MLKRIEEKIKEGYESIPFDIERLIAKSRSYNFKEKEYEFEEYAFWFPYYYDNKDLIQIGKAIRLMEIQATYGQDLIEPLEFHGLVSPVEKLLDRKDRYCWEIHLRQGVNKNCDAFIQRCPLEISRGKTGFCNVYERFATVLKEEKDADTRPVPKT